MAAAGSEKATVTQVRVGCCGFPQALAPYARTFPVVEVQQTFYQPPLLNTLEKWRTHVPAEFEFTLKAWQLITHESSSPTYRRLREKLTEQRWKTRVVSSNSPLDDHLAMRSCDILTLCLTRR